MTIGGFWVRDDGLRLMPSYDGTDYNGSSIIPGFYGSPFEEDDAFTRSANVYDDFTLVIGRKIPDAGGLMWEFSSPL